MKTKKPFIFILLCLLLAEMGFAQAYDAGAEYDTLGVDARREMAVQAIRDLKDGVLVFRLKTGNSQIEAIDKLLARESLSGAVRKGYEERKENIIRENRVHNLAIQSAIREQYKFSEVLFMPDTAVQLLKSGVQSGYFLDKELEVDPSVSLGDRSYIVAYHGTPFTSRKSGVEGFVFLSQDLKELSEPFPFFTGRTTMRKLMAKFFNKTDDVEHYGPLAEKMNERLVEFYGTVQEGSY